MALSGIGNGIGIGNVLPAGRLISHLRLLCLFAANVFQCPSITRPSSEFSPSGSWE